MVWNRHPHYRLMALSKSNIIIIIARGSINYLFYLIKKSKYLKDGKISSRYNHHKWIEMNTEPAVIKK